MSLEFRPLTRDDFPMLSGWLAAPHVARWWREEHDPMVVEGNYGPCVDGADPTEVFVVEREGQSIGMIQRYRFSDNPGWHRALAVGVDVDDAAGIDYLVGVEKLTGWGLGTQIVSRFVEDTWGRYKDIPAIVIAVQQGNRASWRVLEKAGFERVWAGTVDSGDPSDDGQSYICVLYRPDS